MTQPTGVKAKRAIRSIAIKRVGSRAAAPGPLGAVHHLRHQRRAYCRCRPRRPIGAGGHEGDEVAGLRHGQSRLEAKPPVSPDRTDDVGDARVPAPAPDRADVVMRLVASGGSGRSSRHPRSRSSSLRRASRSHRATRIPALPTIMRPGSEDQRAVKVARRAPPPPHRRRIGRRLVVLAIGIPSPPPNDMLDGWRRRAAR